MGPLRAQTQTFAVLLLFALGTWGAPAQGQLPATQDITQCDDMGGQFGECDWLPIVDSITGAQPQPGCPGLEDPLAGIVCVPLAAAAADPSQCANYLAFQDPAAWQECYREMTGEEAPPSCDDPVFAFTVEPCLQQGILPTAPCASTELKLPLLGVCVPDVVNNPPCPAMLLFSDGRGPVRIATDVDLTQPLGTANGVCPGAGGYQNVIPDFEVTPDGVAPSSDPSTLLPGERPLLSISDTTQSILVDRTRFVAGAVGDQLLLSDVTDIDLVGIVAPEMTLVITNGQNVRVLGAQLGAIQVAGGSDITVADSRIGGAGITDGPAVQATGVDGLVLRNLALYPNATAPLVDAIGSSLDLVAVHSLAGPAPQVPCLRVRDAPALLVMNVSVGNSCPAGVLSATGQTIVVDGLAGNVASSSSAAAEIAASTSLTLARLLLVGGARVVDLGASAAPWTLADSSLTGQGIALLGLEGTGPGTVHRTNLRGNAALLEAAGSVPAVPTRIEFTDNQVTRDVQEAVLSSGPATFDQLVDLQLFRADDNDPLGNFRGGPKQGGNWWVRTGLTLWDGDQDGFAEQPVPLIGTLARDERALVPVNAKPSVDAALLPDPADPFVRITEGLALQFNATGSDEEDGALFDVFWTLDGTDLAGGNFTQPAPAPGPHVAVAKARDGMGAIGELVFPFTVLPTNLPPTSDDPVIRPCAGEAPVLTVFQQACFLVHPVDAGAGIDDALDLLYLSLDLTVGVGDVRLGRSLEPVVVPGLFASGFDAGADLVAVGSTGNAPHVVLADDGTPEGMPVLRLGAGNNVSAGDLLLAGEESQGARLQPHHALVGAAATPACAPMPFGIADGLAYLDLDCSGSVTGGDRRIGFDPLAIPAPGPFPVPFDRTLVQAWDTDVDADLTEAPTLVKRFDRDAALRVLWSLEVGFATQSVSGASATLTPQTAGRAVVTLVVADQGEIPSSLVLLLPVDVQSNLAPQAQYVVSPVVLGTGVRVYRNQAITLSDTSIARPATAITSWQWDVTGPSGHFTGTARTLPLQLAALGDHQVSLTVTGANQLTDTKTGLVTVMQAPPSPFAEATPQFAHPIGHEITFTATGSLDLGDDLDAVGDGLSLLRRPVAGSWHDKWVVDLDDDLADDAGDVQLDAVAGVSGHVTGPDEPVLEDADVHVCLADLDGNGAASRRRGVEGLYLVSGPCPAMTAIGQTRLQAIQGPLGQTLEPGSKLAANQVDVGLPLVDVATAVLAAHPTAGVVLDLDGDLKLDAEDLRIESRLGRFAFSRVLPASFADGGGALEYDWSCVVGCGASAQDLSQDARFEWAFTTSGRKVVQVTLTDASGNTVQQTFDVIVANTAPNADFTQVPVAPTPGRSYLTQLDDIRFDGTLSDDVDGGVGGLAYQWVFSDGDTSSLPVVTKRFAAPGTYQVELTVTDGDDVAPLSDTVTKSITILNHVPQPAFQYLPQQPATLTPVAFDGRLSVDPDGSIPAPDGYRWTIQEGATTRTVIGPLASHSFARAGTYTVTLQVTDDRGDAASLTRQVTVANRAPTAVITVDTTVGRAPQQLSFSADQSSDPEVQGAAGFASALWDFGDGSTSTQFNPTHTFARRGLFQIRLTVEDVDGATATARVNVTMLNEAAVASIVLPGSAMVNKSAAFKALAFDQDGDAVTFAWDFGDGTSATGAAVSHTYARHGTYPVTLRAQDEGGGETTVSRLLKVVSPAPVATLKADKTEARVNEEIRFLGTATDDGKVVGHFIDFGDGASTFLANATHRFAKPGNYTVTYRASDDAGESAAAKLSVRVVNPAPRIQSLNVTPNDPKPGDLLLFRAIVDDEDPGVTYLWDFKDGAVSEQSTPIHVYRVAGTFNVVLDVVDAHGGHTKHSFDVVVGGRTVNLKPDQVNQDDGGAGVDRVGQQELPGLPWPATALGLAALAGLLARRRP